MTFNNQPDWETYQPKKEEEALICSTCARDFTEECDDRSSFDEIGKVICMECFDEEEEEEEEEKEEYEFNDYGCKKMYKIKIQVAGGGMINGNAYATVEGEWASEEDFNDGDDGEIYYCEYGINPVKDYRGSQLKFNEDGTSFNIV